MKNSQNLNHTKMPKLYKIPKKTKVSNTVKVNDQELLEENALQTDSLILKQRKSIFAVIYIFVGLFVLVIGYFTYFLLARSNDIINSTYNQRQAVLAERVIRGKILASDHSVLAETIVDEEGKETRVYPYDDVFVHAIGKFNKGRTGIEESENIRLMTSNTNSFGNMYNDLVGQKNPGDNIVTTLDIKLQQIAFDALGDNRGAVVVMEPATGKILAMVSKPTYDPNKIDAIWDELIKDEGTESPLLNRATQGLYPPGSTFKLLTTLAFIRKNPDYKAYEYDCDGSVEYNNMTIHCYNNKSHGEVDLAKSLAKSCNASFASIGKDLDITSFRELSEDFLYNHALPIKMASSISRFELKVGSSGVKETMQTAIGQGRTLVSPLHNAMITAAVANGGVMMKPYIVDHIENADGYTMKSFKPEMSNRAMTTLEANYLEELMTGVVTNGTAKDLKELGITVAGKTGSADTEGKSAHAWFIGFAPVEEPKIVISVIVENVGTGSEYAVPIARKILKAYLLAQQNDEK